MNTPLYYTAQAGFVVLSIVFVGLLIREIHKGVSITGWPSSRKKRFTNTILITVVLWAAAVSLWSLSGKMSDFSIFPINLLPVILIPAVTLVIWMNTKGLAEVLQHIPVPNLIRLQSFRFFVEVLLWILFIANLLPGHMTFEGRNFDILVGFTAPVIAVLALRGKISRTGIIIWNIAGLVLLLNIVTMAVLSTPSPWRVFMEEPANYVVTYFPISWLPGLLVPLAYYLHFLSLKQVLQRKTLVAEPKVRSTGAAASATR